MAAQALPLGSLVSGPAWHAAAVVTVNDADSIHTGIDCGVATLVDTTMMADPAQAKAEARCVTSAFATYHPATVRFLGGPYRSMYLVEWADSSCTISQVLLEMAAGDTYEPAWA